MRDEVLDFINRRFNNLEVIKSFTNGNCYYFAQILKIRFITGNIVYNEIDNHFGYLFNNKVYDITGIICENRNDNLWKNWHRYMFYEPSNAKRVIDYCAK